MSDEEIVEDEIIDVGDEIDLLDDGGDLELDEIDDKEIDLKLSMGGFEE